MNPSPAEVVARYAVLSRRDGRPLNRKAAGWTLLVCSVWRLEVVGQQHFDRRQLLLLWSRKPLFNLPRGMIGYAATDAVHRTSKANHRPSIRSLDEVSYCRARGISLVMLCIQLNACRHDQRVHESQDIQIESAAAPTNDSSITELRDDPLTQELRSSNPMTRYSAAAKAYRDPDATQVSIGARKVLFDMVSNGSESAGVRLWAAMAVAKLEPESALKRFCELDSASVQVDDDAWVILGPKALSYLRSRCTKKGCSSGLLLKLALIVGKSPTERESRATIPLLLLESTRSEQARAIVYRALGSFGPNLVHELQALKADEDPNIRKAATDALKTIH